MVNPFFGDDNFFKAIPSTPKAPPLPKISVKKHGKGGEYMKGEKSEDGEGEKKKKELSEEEIKFWYGDDNDDEGGSDKYEPEGGDLEEKISAVLGSGWYHF